MSGFGSDQLMNGIRSIWSTLTTSFKSLQPPKDDGSQNPPAKPPYPPPAAPRTVIQPGQEGSTEPPANPTKL